MNRIDNVENINELYTKIASLIENAKRNVVAKVNNEMTLLYWNIGKDITENVLKNQKAEYGRSVIKKLSKKLETKYGRGYSKANLFRMLKIYEYFSDFQKFSTLSRKLTWSHFIELLQVQNELKRDFYITMCINENWSVRTLRERIESALFERTSISKKPELTIRNAKSLMDKANDLARQCGIKTNEVLQNYMFERILERLSVSKYKYNFILKLL